MDNIIEFLHSKIHQEGQVAANARCESCRELARQAIVAKMAIMVEHHPYSETDPACAGCGLNAHEDYATAHIDDCPTLNVLAASYR